MGCKLPPDGALDGHLEEVGELEEFAEFEDHLEEAIRSGFRAVGGEPPWTCPHCDFQNKSTNSICGGHGPLGCKSPKGGFGAHALEELEELAPSPSGNWQCTSCGFMNRGSNQVCGGQGPMGCKMPPGAEPSEPEENFYGPMKGKLKGKGMMEMLKGVGKGVIGKGKLGKGMMGKGVERFSPYDLPTDGSWFCPECGFKNPPRNSQCGGTGTLGCNAPRPRPKLPWLCTSCGFNNKESNDVCGGAGPLGCKAERDSGRESTLPFTELVAKALGKGCKKGKGGGGNDWVCDCGFVNKEMNKQCGGTGPMGCNKLRSEVETS